MKKSIMVGVVLAMLAVFGIVGVVSAQGQNPPEGAPAYGYAHDYLIGYAAEVLNMDVETLQARIDAGETLAEIFFAAGYDDFTTFMQEARAYVSEKLAADGVVIPGWTKSQGRGGNMQQFANDGTCTADGSLNQRVGRGGNMGQFANDGTCAADGSLTQQMGRGRRGGRQ